MTSITGPCLFIAAPYNEPRTYGKYKNKYDLWIYPVLILNNLHLILWSRPNILSVVRYLVQTPETMETHINNIPARNTCMPIYFISCGQQRQFETVRKILILLCIYNYPQYNYLSVFYATFYCPNESWYEKNSIDLLQLRNELLQYFHGFRSFSLFIMQINNLIVIVKDLWKICYIHARIFFLLVTNKKWKTVCSPI